MNVIPNDPLSAEERALAAMLARVAPHGVPSPEIDASILSASHDAVAGDRVGRRARARWPMVLGVAASMVLAVGVAWQLLPAGPATGGLDPASSEVGAPEASPAAAPPEEQMVPPALPSDQAAADSAVAGPPHKALQPAAAAPPVNATGKSQPAAALPAPAGAPPAPPAPPAAPAPSVSSVPAGPAAALALDAEKATPGAAAQRADLARQVESTAARTASGATEAATNARRELRVAPSSERAQDAAPEADSGAVRTRRTDLQVPVAADAQLQVGDWLERVRTRYGLGDEEAARRSLLLFVQDHPTETVPGDLEPLLDE